MNCFPIINKVARFHWSYLIQILVLIYLRTCLDLHYSHYLRISKTISLVTCHTHSTWLTALSQLARKCYICYTQLYLPVTVPSVFDLFLYGLWNVTINLLHLNSLILTVSSIYRLLFWHRCCPARMGKCI